MRPGKGMSSLTPRARIAKRKDNATSIPAAAIHSKAGRRRPHVIIRAILSIALCVTFYSLPLFDSHLGHLVTDGDLVHNVHTLYYLAEVGIVAVEEVGIGLDNEE